MFGSKRRFVILRDHGRLLPKPGPLAQMSQTAATVNSWDCSDVRIAEGPTLLGQPHKSIRSRPRSHANRGPPGGSYPDTRGRRDRRPRDLGVTGREASTAGRGRCDRRPAAGAGSPTLALAALAAAREEIDALNVYPVPDGDTGTNLFLTFESAARRAARACPSRRRDDLRRGARGAAPAARCSAPAATPA